MNLILDFHHQDINNNKSKQNQAFIKKLIDSKAKTGILKQIDNVQLSLFEGNVSSPFNVILKKEFVINVWKNQLCEKIDVLSHKRKRSAKKIV